MAWMQNPCKCPFPFFNFSFTIMFDNHRWISFNHIHAHWSTFIFVNVSLNSHPLQYVHEGYIWYVHMFSSMDVIINFVFFIPYNIECLHGNLTHSMKAHSKETTSYKKCPRHPPRQNCSGNVLNVFLKNIFSLKFGFFFKMCIWKRISPFHFYFSCFWEIFTYTKYG